jgi:hypothetical protein
MPSWLRPVPQLPDPQWSMVQAFQDATRADIREDFNSHGLCPICERTADDACLACGDDL